MWSTTEPNEFVLSLVSVITEKDCSFQLGIGTTAVFHSLNDKHIKPSSIITCKIKHTYKLESHLYFLQLCSQQQQAPEYCQPACQWPPGMRALPSYSGRTTARRTSQVPPVVPTWTSRSLRTTDERPGSWRCSMRVLGLVAVEAPLDSNIGIKIAWLKFLWQFSNIDYVPQQRHKQSVTSTQCSNLMY